jgi:hypothetical protein
MGDNPNYFITEFISTSPDYIGFDAVNDAITRNSHSILSLNMVKNMLVRFAVGDSGTPKKFNTMVTSCNKVEYDKLLKDFKLYMQAVFNNIEPFSLIKQQGTSSIPSLREEYISLTGAGLYIIATMGFLARSKNIDLEATAKRLAELDWKRERRDEYNLRRVNPLFMTGILNNIGNISNTRNAIKATIDSIRAILDL